MPYRLILTDEDIQKDIEKFNERINHARSKLAALPETADTRKEQQKIKEHRRILASEIEHVNRLIGIARESLIDA